MEITEEDMDKLIGGQDPVKGNSKGRRSVQKSWPFHKGITLKAYEQTKSMLKKAKSQTPQGPAT